MPVTRRAGRIGCWIWAPASRTDEEDVAAAESTMAVRRHHFDADEAI